MTEPNPAAPPLFSAEVAGLARGTLDAEATMGLHELVQSVAQLEKPGKLMVELTVEPAGSAGRTVTIAGRVVSKPPKPAPEVSIRFVGDGGTLHRDDPFVKPLPGIPYRDADGEVKVVDAASGQVRRVDEPPVAPTRIDDDDEE